MSYSNFKITVKPDLYEYGYIIDDDTKIFNEGDLLKIVIPKLCGGLSDTYKSNKIIKTDMLNRLINTSSSITGNISKRVELDDYLLFPIQFDNVSNVSNFNIVTNSNIICRFINQSFEKGVVLLRYENIMR